MSKLKTWAKIHSPEILLVSAILTAAMSVISGCIATAKVGKRIIEPAKPTALELHNKVEELEQKLKSEDYELYKDVYANDLKIAKRKRNVYYLKVGGKIVLYYLPTVLSFSLSVASMVGSHNIMRGRNIALATAFTTLKASYDGYKDRVRAKYGEEAEKELSLDSNKKTVVVKDQKGKEHSTTVDTPKEDNTNLFEELWGPGNLAYDSRLGARANLTWLYNTERILNQKLRADGVLFLSDVYDVLGYSPAMLGRKKILASRVVGWKFDPEASDCDGLIDFGLRDRNGNETQEVKDFLVGRTEYLRINLNVDGDIVTNDEAANKATDLLIAKSK